MRTKRRLRCQETTKRGDKVDPTRVFDVRTQGVHLARLVDQTDLVTKPGDQRTKD
jgi:hypothetical protein